MGKASRIFTDLDLNFTANPVTKDVAVKNNTNAIKQAVKNLILTQHFERPFHPEIGSQVRSLLFEQYNPLTQSMLQQVIENTIENFEPRVRLNLVNVTFSNDNQSVYVSIDFTILNTQEPLNVDFTLDKTR